MELMLALLTPPPASTSQVVGCKAFTTIVGLLERCHDGFISCISRFGSSAKWCIRFSNSINAYIAQMYTCVSYLNGVGRPRAINSSQTPDLMSPEAEHPNGLCGLLGCIRILQ